MIGLAPSARAARELQDGSGIGSTTIARHRVEQRPITATTLVVIDEAAMAGTRDVAALIDQATSVGAKVVFVGDHHQLPEVAAGGAFRAALDTLGDRVVELTVNRRQTARWEQAALDELRCGDVPTAFAAYRDTAGSSSPTHPTTSTPSSSPTGTPPAATGDTLLLAGTRAEARLLNRYARDILAANGELDLDHEIEFAGRGLHRRRPRRARAATTLDQHLTRARPSPSTTACAAPSLSSPRTHDRHDHGGEQVVLDRDYLDRGWVDHAYAVTIHKAQGVTCDYVFVVGPAGLYREGAYVALSRARYTSLALRHQPPSRRHRRTHRHGIPLPTEPVPDPEAELLARLQQRRQEPRHHRRPSADSRRTRRHVPAPELRRRARHAAAAEHDCGAQNPAEHASRLDAASPPLPRRHRPTSPCRRP